MTEDEYATIINRLIKECSDHTIPSKDTKQFMQEITKAIQVNNIAIEVMKEQMKNNTEEHKEIKEQSAKESEATMNCLKEIREAIKAQDSKFAEKEEFIFWRNLLVLGLLLTIVTGIIFLVFEKYFNR